MSRLVKPWKEEYTLYWWWWGGETAGYFHTTRELADFERLPHEKTSFQYFTQNIFHLYRCTVIHLINLSISFTKLWPTTIGVICNDCSILLSMRKWIGLLVFLSVFHRYFLSKKSLRTMRYEYRQLYCLNVWVSLEKDDDNKDYATYSLK